MHTGGVVVAYHRVGSTFITTEEVAQHGMTLFGLGVAICVGGAAALALYYVLHAMPYFVAHEEQAKSAYWGIGILFFVVGLKYVRVILLSSIAVILAWSAIAAVFALPVQPWVTPDSQSTHSASCQPIPSQPRRRGELVNLCSDSGIPVTDVETHYGNGARNARLPPQKLRDVEVERLADRP